MARIIEQAAAREYDGVITTITDYDVLKSAIKAVTDKGIPLIIANSGTHEQSESLGAIMHVGQPEYVAGKGAGEKAKKAGIKSFLCVNHCATNPASFERCRGFGDALGVDFKSSTIDTGEDPTTVQNKVSTFLRKNLNTGSVLTLGPSSAHPTIRALTDNGLLGDIWFASFDLSEEIAAGVKKATYSLASTNSHTCKAIFLLRFWLIICLYGELQVTPHALIISRTQFFEHRFLSTKPFCHKT